ncbi:Formamidopyrimidine-DNA glycosylase [Azospirillaceae bacterium]
MPELPEVETIRRGLAGALLGRRFVRVDVRRPNLRAPLPLHLAERLLDRRVDAIRRRGKYLLLTLDDASTLLIHLGMSGRIIIASQPPASSGRHDHVEFITDDRTIITYSDPRRFGMIDLIPDLAALTTYPSLAHLGPEPLPDLSEDPPFVADSLAPRLSARSSPIKTVLLDQRTVAGLGNIYVCESLFYAGIHPERPASSLSSTEIKRLVVAIQDVLRRAIAAGGSSLRDYVQASGEMGYFQHSFAVYDRVGESCPGCVCRAETAPQSIAPLPDLPPPEPPSPELSSRKILSVIEDQTISNGGIVRLTQAGRSTFYCPRRQR